ncbi:MAG TPA: hypothetical protein PKN32_14965 [Bacteroidales bacterium]|nr:hypothetical protein [Bacteroidales bacterium]
MIKMLVRKADLNDLSNIIDLWYEMMVFHVNVNDIYRLKDNAKTISIDNYLAQSFWKKNNYTGYNEICYKYL